MTNYEWMKTLPLEEMARLLNNSGDCSLCAYKDAGCASNCEEGVREWLQQEYEEPKKLVDVNRLIKDINAHAYCSSEYCEHHRYDGCMVCIAYGRECRIAISNYIREMKGDNE